MPTAPEPSPPDSRPVLSFDLDGVLARPPLGLTLTMNRDLTLRPRDSQPPHAPDPAGWWDRLLARTYYRVRYAGRAPLPRAIEAVAAAAAHHRVIVLTGRNWRGRAATEAWLRRHGLRDHLTDIVMNDTGWPSPQFKRWAVTHLGIVRHVEDDPATAALLARAGVAVDLIDWPRNRGLDYPPGVTRRLGLGALADSLRGSD